MWKQHYHADQIQTILSVFLLSYVMILSLCLCLGDNFVWLFSTRQCFGSTFVVFSTRCILNHNLWWNRKMHLACTQQFSQLVEFMRVIYGSKSSRIDGTGLIFMSGAYPTKMLEKPAMERKNFESICFYLHDNLLLLNSCQRTLLPHGTDTVSLYFANL